MVSAWATANHVSLGQVVTDAKSNEITAIPKLLEIVEVSGSLVTIDAQGCQQDIAQKIVDQGADYCLAVKRNQPTLHDSIEDFFVAQQESNFKRAKVHRHETHEKGHGREESRSYYICPVNDEIITRDRWSNLRAIGMTINIVKQGGNETSEVRYYILSKYLSGKRFAEAVRGHWGIENSLHWQLDVTFGEDQSRIRKGHADANFSLLRRTSLSLLKNNKTAKVGVKNKRLKCGWGDDYRMEVLLGR
ncbi:Transposase DDE domain protein [Bremerella volcania]|nr:Transposase DDE domain protein [Bremerella volcania]